MGLEKLVSELRKEIGRGGKEENLCGGGWHVLRGRYKRAQGIFGV